MPATRGAVRARSITTSRLPNGVPDHSPSNDCHTRAMPERPIWKKTPSMTMGAALVVMRVLSPAMQHQVGHRQEVVAYQLERARRPVLQVADRGRHVGRAGAGAGVAARGQA